MNSLWHIASRKNAVNPPLQGDHIVDVAIVGGGVTGLAAALKLVDAGQRVAVLEAHRIGEGNTGKSTGNLYATVSQGLHKIQRKWDEDTVRQLVATRSKAVDFVEEMTNRFAIDCQFTRRPLHFCVSEPSEQLEQMLREEYEASIAAGLSARLIDQVPELPFPVRRALRIENQAQYNPLRFAQGLAHAVSRLGGIICEDTRVVDADADKGKVFTEAGSVEAAHIFYATHTPLGFNLLQAEMEVYREYGISARLQNATYPDGIFWMMNDSRSIRSYEYGGNRYLAVIGEKHKTGQNEQDKNYYEKNRAYARAHFDVANFEHQWSAQQFISADLLPYIGRSGHDNVFVGTGYAADGLTWGMVAGGVISDLILGRENSAAELFNPRRFTPMKSAKTWMSENATVAKHFVKDYLTPAKLKNLKEVLPGEGKIVSIDGEKLAVYRSPENRLSVLSPVCPHLKCMVNWNAADITWDCPCHGSRFSVSGDVIEGPAFESLVRRVPGS